MPRDEQTRKAIAASYALLGHRPYSRHELARRLGRDIESVEAVEAALDWLESRRYIDDRRLAEDAVRCVGERRGWGRRRLQHWLQERGIDECLAEEAFALIDPDLEAERARALAIRQRERGKRPDQVFRFLVSRGFTTDVARQIALHEET